MYIGDVGKRGLHHLIYEVVDNSIDEALAGFAQKLMLFSIKMGLSPLKTMAAEYPLTYIKKKKNLR